MTAIDQSAHAAAAAAAPVVLVSRADCCKHYENHKMSVLFRFVYTIQGAREAYESAYRVSIMVSGADTPPTLDVKSLAEHTPTSVHELRARYSGGTS